MWQVRGGSVSMERLDGETIAINFDSGEYFSFRGSSADILWLVATDTPPDSWARLLEAAFDGFAMDAQSRDQIDAFLNGLAEAGIITDGGAGCGAADALPNDYVRSAWTPPTVHANDDLVDLLVIDPIHDSSEDGWPETRSE